MMTEADLWRLFEILLARALDLMPFDSYLIVSTASGPDDPGRYVQFARWDDGLRAESVSDAFLPSGAGLTAADVGVLERLGFCAPSVSVERADAGYDSSEGSVNWVRDFHEPVDAAVPASIAVRALREVHDVSSPPELCSCAFAEGPEAVPHPALGIARVGEEWLPAAALDLDGLIDRGRWFDALSRLARQAEGPPRSVSEARVLLDMGLAAVQDVVASTTGVGTGLPGRVVWGMVDYDEPVFISADRAEELATLWDALGQAETWGDLRRLLPALLYAETVAWCWGEPADPMDHTPFDVDSVAVIADGDWPAWPAQEMLAWMPQEIIDRYGDISPSNFNGMALRLDESHSADVVTALNDKGVEVIRDDTLVARAHGN